MNINNAGTWTTHFLLSFLLTLFRRNWWTTLSTIFSRHKSRVTGRGFFRWEGTRSSSSWRGKILGAKSSTQCCCTRSGSTQPPTLQQLKQREDKTSLFSRTLKLHICWFGWLERQLRKTMIVKQTRIWCPINISIWGFQTSHYKLPIIMSKESQNVVRVL